MGIIHVLDARVANQIAAGEVIERPSSAVKELVENALDAHAQNITVEIENGGVDLIKVTDDGDGFYKDDLPLAICRHATSKIVDFNDVYRLDTFGFRGEALASIAVISRLRITSGKNENEPANIFTSDAEGKNALTVAAPQKGTCIEVRDLYYNVPARKKFVKSNSHESALIYDLLCKFALGFPEVNFTFVNGGEVLFSSNQLNEVDTILRYLYHEVGDDDIIHIKNEGFYQKQALEAWFLPTTITRKNRSHMTYFVNGRLIESRELDQIIDEAVYTLVPKGRFLVCVLKLSVPAFNIDVNIHPSKKLIKFKNIEEWRTSLVTLLKEELWLSRLSVPFQMNSPKDDGLDEEFHLEQQAVKSPVIPQTINFHEEPKREAVFEEEMVAEPSLMEQIIDKTDRVEKIVPRSHKVAEMPATYVAVKPQTGAQSQVQPSQVMAPPTQATTSCENKSALKANDLQDLVYIGQLNQTFILAQDKENLYIIDQHTLHERILYERFMKAYNQREVVKQPLLHPVALQVSPLQESALVQHILTLDELGFTVESKGPLNYALVTVPVVLSQESDLKMLFTDMLDDLQTGTLQGGLAALNEERIIMASCKAAVKAHYKLTESEVRYLFESLSSLDNPHTCPHGRPIIMNISMNELYLFFKRGSY